MPSRAPHVDTFMAELEHPFKAGVEQLRAAILASNDGITEHVKWNAPSFCYAGVDRVTFRDLEDVAARQAAVVGAVNRWVLA
jgi:hypothetical protein